MDWMGRDEALLAFTRKLLRIRRGHPALRRQKFFSGRPIRGSEIHDVMWFRHDGRPMSDEDWNNPHTHSLGMLLAGNGLDEFDRHGRRISDDHLFLVMSSSTLDLHFTLPDPGGCAQWEVMVDTSDDHATESRAPGQATLLPAHSLKLFRALLRRPA
jgi:glycogen operon protein